MVDSILFKERKYPFIFAFFLLLIFVTLLLINNSESPYLLIARNQSRLKSSFSNSTAPISVSSSPVATSPSESDGESPSRMNTSNITAFDIQWRSCGGAVAVDFIPCLDNWNAIKALQSRRHMEHRERHCPKPNPRCLVPLPSGYKSPVPWPKSRDMVRLILLCW